MLFRCALVMMILTAGGLATASSSAAANAAKTCIDCHKKVIAKRVVHSAVSQYARMEQGCESCHTASHAKKKGELSLAAKVPELCYMCHDQGKFTKTNVHPPVAGGDCLTCHNPHASDAPRLMNQPVPSLCQNCHPDKTHGKHILAGYGFGDNHPILGRIDPTKKGRELGCVSCHDPHSSARRSLLVNDKATDPENLCMLCHSKITVRP